MDIFLNCHIIHGRSQWGNIMSIDVLRDRWENEAEQAFNSRNAHELNKIIAEIGDYIYSEHEKISDLAYRESKGFISQIESSEQSSLHLSNIHRARECTDKVEAMRDKLIPK